MEDGSIEKRNMGLLRCWCQASAWSSSSLGFLLCEIMHSSSAHTEPVFADDLLLKAFQQVLPSALGLPGQVGLGTRE